MAGTAIPGRLSWRLADIVDVVLETPRVKTLVLDVPDWPGHLPGQHVDIRLTAEDGYQAQRSYSISSAPAGERLEITVERLDDGEVSPYLVDVLRSGDKLELRGPVGLYFTWDVGDGGPLFLIAGGSGVAPLMAMIRHRAKTGSRVPARLLLSSRSPADIIYRSELDRLASDDTSLEVIHTLTRFQPPEWQGYRRRIDREMLTEVGWPPEERPRCYICGPTQLVETAAAALVELGHDAACIRTERYGPSG